MPHSLLLMAVLLAALMQHSQSESPKCPFMAATPQGYHGAAGGGAIPGGFDAGAFNAVDWSALRSDIESMLTDSQDFWPADFGNYGPLFVRQAWYAPYPTPCIMHPPIISDLSPAPPAIPLAVARCASVHVLIALYSSSPVAFTALAPTDRPMAEEVAMEIQRFDPEMSWADNPIKLKYGPGLSWGDLIMFTGNVAIESMGGPKLDFCAGRLDDANGDASLPLGPSAKQENTANCTIPGNCTDPLGASVVGLIYVDPAGYMGQPVPEDTVQNIRDVFDRMGMNDSETVALVGGGHAFGKAHGACPSGPGPTPAEDPYNPYPGTCGSGELKGKGDNAVTSGFEGAWTTLPTNWTNQYFKNLLRFDWNLTESPAGNPQWMPMDKGTDTPAAEDIMMLTTDIAFLHDPEYLALVELFATDEEALNSAFAAAWYKLSTRDMGPLSRCMKSDSPLPPAQEWQFPLPPASKTFPKWVQVNDSVREVMSSSNPALEPDMVDRQPTYGAMFAMLAWQCASSFRTTDYRGGCNGASIRFSPQKDWPTNAYMDMALEVLSLVKEEFGDELSWADLIVFAGTMALEDAGSPHQKFCPGRADYEDGKAAVGLEPWSMMEYAIEDPIWSFRHRTGVQGLTNSEAVALQGMLRSPEQMKRLGYSGSWTNSSTTLSNEYFQVLLSNSWVAQESALGMDEWAAVGKDLYMTADDIALKYDYNNFLPIAQMYASNETKFLNDFSLAWKKMMNADRFKGPVASIDGKHTKAIYWERSRPVVKFTNLVVAPTAATEAMLTFNVVGHILPVICGGVCKYTAFEKGGTIGA
eukprot:gene27303-4606_t